MMRQLARGGQAILPVLIVLWTGAIACPPLFAAITPTALTGRVTSANAPLGGVTVTVTSPALQRERTTLTNADGRYFFAALPPGRYDVTFAKSGHTSFARPVMVELGRVARADATLTPSADEESVTSTATNVTVSETTAITTHFSDGELDRLPLPLDRLSAYTLAPRGVLGALLVDDAPFSGFLGFEGIDELTVFRGGYPIELERDVLDTVSARIPAGGERFTLSLRDTYSHVRGEGGHLVESASGGRIVRDRLWFYAGGYGGDVFLREGMHGVQLKLTGQVGAAHNLVASWIHSDDSGGGALADEHTNTNLRYTGVFGPHVTAEASLHDMQQNGFFGVDARTGTARVAWVTGNHVLRGGATHWDSAFGDATSFFLADRWSAGRFTVDAGVRHDEHESFATRAAATYDLRGDGRHAIAASFSESGVDMATLGYATALGNSGQARVDYIRRWSGGNHLGQIALEARYRLFDRFEAGGSYTWSDSDRPFDEGHAGQAWAGLTLPAGSHEIGATLLERYELEEWVTDLAVRWSLPVARAGVTLGADANNVLGAEAFMVPRTWRFWARLRI